MRMELGVDRRVLVLALARMADSMGNSFLIVVLPLYIASGHVTGTAFGLSQALITGLVLSMFGLFNSVLQPFTGRLSDRTGRRTVFILVGLIVLTVTNFAYAFADTYVLLVVNRAIQGIGVAFTITATIALVNEYATDADRGGNMGVFNTFRLIGFGLGPIVAGAIVHRGPYDLSILGGLHPSGYEAAFYVAAAGALLSTVLVALVIEDAEEATADAGGDLSIAVLAERSDGLLDPVFTLGLASLFMAMGIALFSTIQPEINAHLNQSPTLFGMQFGAFVLAQIFFQYPVGRASDQYGRKRFVVAGLVLLAPVTFLQGLVWAPWQMLLARFVQGIAGAMVFAPSLALAGDVAKQGQSGTKLSVLTMSFGLGTALGPLSSGYLIRFGYAIPFAFGAVLAAVGAVLVYSQVEETRTGEQSGAHPGGASPSD
ncbi:MAG: MFS transporter [Halanaeroarchaeum sp.]